MLATKKRKYLFFISQDYSFPVLRPLQKAIELRGDTVKWFLYGNEIDYAHLDSTEIRLYSIEDIIAFKPNVVFVPGNVVPSFIPGLKVEVFHGLPSEKRKKTGELYHYTIRGMFDLYCTQGPSSTKVFQRLSKKYKTFSVQETGWSKLDPLFHTKTKDFTDKTIFFASTFSPRFSKAKELYPFILHMIKTYAFKWNITLHPKMDKETVSKFKSIDSPKVQFIESVDIIESFKESDIMLCDTSSIIYEFLTQSKPVITYQTATEHSSLINVTDIGELEKTILETLAHPNKNTKSIQDYVKEFHPYTDGQSSQRVLDAVDVILGGKNIASRKKPLNLIRNFKLRRELNYWKF